jgi:DNA-binding XRE family transcriptional regulator
LPRVLAPPDHAPETERYDPSLPLAFTIAKLFRRRIEDVIQP